jgi:hypothetical protein
VRSRRFEIAVLVHALTSILPPVLRRATLLIAAVALVAALPAAATVERGVLTPGKGARGIKLGMTRAQVVARLGQPLYENRNGYMEFSRNHLFDVYLDVATRPKRVRLIGVAGPTFCLAGTDLCLDEPGGVRVIREEYGTALVREHYESGDVYALYGSYRGCPTLTEFLPHRFRPSSPIGMVFIGFKDGPC